MDGYSVHYNFMETTTCMISFNPRKWPTAWMLAREFKTSRIIQKSKNREIKVTRKFPNLQYFHPLFVSASSMGSGESVHLHNQEFDYLHRLAWASTAWQCNKFLNLMFWLKLCFRCLNWQLPSSCHLDPPAPGKCCQTPNCPSSVILTYPPDYVPE